MTPRSDLLPSLWRDRRALITLLLILAVSLAVRCVHLLHDGLWTDEMISLYTSNPEASLRRTYDVLHFWDQTPPLYPVALWLWLKITGFTDLQARLFSVLGGILSLIAGYGLIQEVFSRRTALAVTFLSALTPYHIYFSREARSYIWALLLATCFVHALIRRLRGDESLRLRLWFICSGAAFLYVSYFSFFIHAAAVLVVFGSWLLRRPPAAVIRAWLLDWAGIALLYLPWLIPFFRILSFHNGGSSSVPQAGYLLEVLSVFSGAAAAGWMLVLAYGLLLTVVAIPVLRRPPSPRAEAPLMIAVALFAIAYGLMLVKSLTGRNILNGFAYSYVIVLYPLYGLALGSLLNRLRPSVLYGFCTAFLAFALLHLQAWSHLALGKKQPEPYREMAQLIARSPQSTAPILVSGPYVQEFYFSRLGLAGQLLSPIDLAHRFAASPPAQLWILDSYDRKADLLLTELARHQRVRQTKVFEVPTPDHDASFRAILVTLSPS